MKEILFSLIGVSLIQSVLLLMIKDERFEKIIKLIGGVAMAAILTAGLTEFDYQAYAASLQREKAQIQWNEDSIKEEVNQLNRRYIESECAAYILESADRLQIGLSDVTVTLAWKTDGYWYPVHAEMTVTGYHEDLSPLKRLIESELGIPIAEQVWRAENE